MAYVPIWQGANEPTYHDLIEVIRTKNLSSLQQFMRNHPMTPRLGSQQHSILHEAATLEFEEDDREFFQYLLTLVSDVNIKRTSDNQTPLNEAIENQNYEFAKILIKSKSGVKPFLNRNGVGPLGHVYEDEEEADRVKIDLLKSGLKLLTSEAREEAYEAIMEDKPQLLDWILRRSPKMRQQRGKPPSFLLDKDSLIINAVRRNMSCVEILKKHQKHVKVDIAKILDTPTQLQVEKPAMVGNGHENTCANQKGKEEGGGGGGVNRKPFSDRTNLLVAMALKKQKP